MSHRNIAVRASSPRFDRRSTPKSASIAAAVFETLEQRQLMSTFSVSNLSDSGNFTLRQAIINANNSAGADTIQFTVPGGGVKAINVLSPLPAITEAVTIDASTQPTTTYHLNGFMAGPGNGLTIRSDDVTIRGLTILSFDYSGVVIESGTNNKIFDCFISSNDIDAVQVLTAGNTVGGPSLTDRNYLVASGRHGLLVRGSFAAGTGNLISGNVIGLARDANETAIGNAMHGISLESSGNTVTGNTVSANEGDGIHIERTIDFRIGFGSDGYEFGPEANDNVVSGNRIGTTLDGETGRGNSFNGVQIINGLRNTIGGTTSTGRNIIADNRRRGVTVTAVSESDGFGGPLNGVSQDNVVIGNYIGLTASGAALGNTRSGVAFSVTPGNAASFVLSNRVGGSTTGERNVIGSNVGPGIALADGSAGTLVQGNYIGTDPTGTATRPNLEAGVFIGDSQGNTIGGRFTSQRNVISGNEDDGVRIISTNAASTPSNSNLVYNNYIGTTADGTAALANSLYGVRIIGGSTNQIGNTFIDTGNAGNLISGNGLAGVGIGIDTPDFTEIGTTASNSILNNSIGTNAAGTAAITNVGGGMILNGTAAVPTTSTFVGGANNGAQRRGNVIVSDQLHVGVIVNGGAADTSLLGNRIGTNAAGTALIGNIGNPMIVNGPGTIIGSAAAGTGNVIGGGVTPGIVINSLGALNITIAGNSIGTDPGGTINLGNFGAGIYIDTTSNFGTPNTTIGGTTAAAENRIAFNGSGGITIVTSRDVEILRNRIYSNNGLGIDLGANGITPNDVGDGDSGPNSYQNFPVLSAVNQAGVNVTIPTALNSIASTTFRIDYYAVMNPNSSGSGACDVFLGSATVTTNASGNASASPTFSLIGAVGATAITATATRTGTFNDTSEFAANRSIVPVQPAGVWDGGGDATNWSDANNWSNNTLPTSNDDVLIQTPGAFTINLANAVTTVNSLTLGNGSNSNPTLALVANGNRVLVTDALTINGSSKLDLNDNDLIIDYSGASPLDSVKAKINTARNGGLWNGTGITSSTAAGNPKHNTTLGAMEASDYRTIHGGPPQFDGQPIDQTGVLVKYTYYGDVDFSGIVDFDDYSRIDSGFNGNKTGWLNGDVDGNGIVDFDDYSLIDQAFNTQGPALRPATPRLGGKQSPR